MDADPDVCSKVYVYFGRICAPIGVSSMSTTVYLRAIILLQTALPLSCLHGFAFLPLHICTTVCLKRLCIANPVVSNKGNSTPLGVLDSTRGT